MCLKNAFCKMCVTICWYTRYYLKHSIHILRRKNVEKEISFTEGPVFQSLLRFAIPVLGALILQAAYGAVDLLIVGKFGNASSISAVGTGSSFMQMATFIITSLAMGSTVIIGHHIENKNQKKQEMRSELRSFFF